MTSISIVASLLALAASVGSVPVNTIRLPLPARMQWDANYGYCGEMSLTGAGMYYGQYMSQFTARALVSKTQSRVSDQVLLGVNDAQDATQMRLRSTRYDPAAMPGVAGLVQFIKSQLLLGSPVAIGIYTNGGTDSDYDHIVPVIGIQSAYSLTDTTYHPDDVIIFNDNYQSTVSISLASFVATRSQANQASRGDWSLPADPVTHYAIAINGIMDPLGETFPVSVDPLNPDGSYCYEEVPVMVDGSNTAPPSSLMLLRATISGLTPGLSYTLHRYRSTASVPQSNFNANPGDVTTFIASSSTYVVTDTVQNSDTVIYRATLAASVATTVTATKTTSANPTTSSLTTTTKKTTTKKTTTKKTTTTKTKRRHN